MKYMYHLVKLVLDLKILIQLIILIFIEDQLVKINLLLKNNI